MKKILFYLFIFASFGAIAQDPVPADSAYHALPTYSLKYYTKDSSVWIYKGSKYQTTKLVSNKRLKFLIDSIGGSFVSKDQTIPDTMKYGSVVTEGIQFDTTPTTTNVSEGLLRWNPTDNTLDLGVRNGLSTQQIGQETTLPAYNLTGTNIAEGVPVYITGRHGTMPTISPARSNSTETSNVFGITTTTFGSTGDLREGLVTTFGYVRKIKTNYTGVGAWGTTWVENDKLYTSKTVAGQLTNVEPNAPHHADVVATVAVIGSVGTGSILVLNEKHKTLKDLADINGTPLTQTGQLPIWNQDSLYFDFGLLSSDYVTIPVDGGSPTINTLTEHITTAGSSGVANGNIVYVTQGSTGTKISVAAGDGYIRTTNSQQGLLKSMKWNASPDLYTMPTPAAGYESSIIVGIEYNGSICTAVTKSSLADFNLYSNFPLARVSYDGSELYIVNAYAHAEDTPNHTRQYLRKVFGFTRENAPEGTGGLELGATNRQLSMTSGKMWMGFNNYTFSAITSGTSFDLYYRKSGGGFNKSTATNFPNTQYDNGSGTLQDLTTNRYGTLWVYLSVDESHLDVVYGAVNAVSVSSAQEDVLPSVPDHLVYGGKLIGRIIFQKSATSASLIESAWDNTFSATAVGNHSLLSNLQGGIAGQYYHLSLSQRDTVLTAEQHADTIRSQGHATVYDASLKVDKNATITGATKTKITYDAKGLVTSGVDATTADIASSTDKRYVTDTQLSNIHASGSDNQDLSGLAPISGGANYIWNQNASAQTANMWINGGVKASYLTVYDSASADIYINAGTSYQSTVGYYLAGVAKWALQNKGDGTDVFRFYNYANGEVFSLTPNGSATFASTIQATTAKLTNLSDGYLPYHISDASGLGNSPIYTDGTNVGIGTVSPTALLQVGSGIKMNSDYTISWGTYRGNMSWDTGKAIIHGTAGNDLSFGSNGVVDQMYIKSGGNVGISTTNPSEKLHVVGNALVSGNGAFNGDYVAVWSTTYGGVVIKNFSNNSAKINTYTPTPTGRFLAIQDEYISPVGVGYNNDSYPGGYTAKLWVNGSAYLNGTLIAASLSGTGTRMVVADSGGTLSSTNSPTLATVNLTTGAAVNKVWQCTNATTGAGQWATVSTSATYIGTWNASTNTPTIADGTGTAGQYYRVTTAGTWNSIAFSVGDDVSYNGTVWQRLPAPTITGNALTKTDDTNVTLTLGGSPSTALLNAASIAVGWTGTLADGRIASASTWNAKESALTFGTGLSRTGNTITNTITNNNQLTNGAGYITGYTETDPTIYAWAKAATKPSYTYTEVGAAPSSTVSFPGFGTSHSLAAYGDHNHSGVYDNYSSWLIAGSGTAGTGTVSSGSTVTLSGSGATSITRSGTNLTVSSTDTNWYPTGTSWSGGTLTISGVGMSNITANLDGRYLLLSGGSLTGAVTSTSTFTGTNFILSSDLRLKADIKPLNKRINLNYYQYRFKSDTSQVRYGVVAQELEKTNPELVRTDKDGMKSVAYVDLLIAKIAELEQRIKALEDEK